MLNYYLLLPVAGMSNIVGQHGANQESDDALDVDDLLPKERPKEADASSQHHMITASDPLQSFLLQEKSQEARELDDECDYIYTPTTLSGKSLKSLSFLDDPGVIFPRARSRIRRRRRE